MKAKTLLLIALVSTSFVLALYALTSTPEMGGRFVPSADPYPTLRLIVPDQMKPWTDLVHGILMPPEARPPEATPASPPVHVLVDAPKFLVLGDVGCVVTTIATDIDCWSATSGGAGGAGVPDADDTTNLDANSGAGTGTMDAAMTTGTWNLSGFTGTLTTGGFALTITGSFTNGGTFNAGASTITVSASWVATSGTFNIGTSTVVKNGGSIVTTVGSASVNNFYNLTASGLVTLSNAVGVANVLTASASATLNTGAACGNGYFLNGAAATPFVRGASVTVWTPIRFNTSVGAAVPAGEYRGAPGLEFLSAQTFTPAGNVSTSLACGGGNAALGDIEIEAGTYAKGTTTLAIADDLVMAGGDLTSTSGDVTITDDVSISSAASAITFGSEIWTISGTWTNASTDTAVWDPGTGIVLFNAATAQTFTFGGSNLGEDEFNDVDMASTGAGEVTFTMATRGLQIVDLLNLYSSTVLNTSGANLSVTAGSLTLAVGSGITLNASTLTVSGSITNSGTYSGASATLVLSGSSTQVVDLAGSDINALSVTGSGQKSFTSAFTTSSVSASVAVTFEVTAGVTWTHNGTTLAGVAGGFLTLRSSASGTPWNLTRGGASLTASRVDVADSTASATVDACDGTNVDAGGNSGWDFCVEGPPPPGPRTLSIDVICGYNSFVRVWSCTDRTDYTGWMPAVFERLTYQYDGREVAAVSAFHGSTTFEAGGSVLDGETYHLLIVTWHLFNGGTPSASYVLHIDNRPVQVAFALLGLVLLAAIVAAVIRRRGGKISWEQVPNPAYRRWPSEEFPKGWRTYRRTPHRPELPTRSERRGDLWVIYQLRAATPGEQARTGRKRVAYVQAVREKM